MRYLLWIAFLFVITSCNPRPPFLEPAPNGPPKFQKGWDDGCITGLAMTGNTWYKTWHRFTQDPFGAQDIVYYKGWKDGMWFCSRRVEMWLIRDFWDVKLLPELQDELGISKQHSIWDWFGWGGMDANPGKDRMLLEGDLPY